MDKQGTIRIEMTYQNEIGSYTPIIQDIFINNLQSEKSPYAVYITDIPQINVQNLQLTDCTFNNVGVPYNLNNTTDVIFKNVKINGQVYTGVKNEIDARINDNFKLEQNYPNPFNPTTVIKYNLPVDVNLSLKIYDILENEVVTIFNKFQNAGNYTVQLSAFDYQLSSGIYFYTLHAEDFTETK